MLSVEDTSAGQMSDSVPFPVLFSGTTISVIATDKHARIEYATAIAMKPIKAMITRCGTSFKRNISEKVLKKFN